MYKIVYEKRVFKDLDKIPSADANRITDVFKGLTSNPFPNGSKKLSGKISLYRIRQGDYRVIYTVEHGTKEIRIIMVGNRKEVYRILSRHGIS